MPAYTCPAPTGGPWRLDDEVEAQARAVSAIIERAAQDAILRGRNGVLVLHGAFRVIAAEHSAVPYGQMYEAPSTAQTDEALAADFAAWKPRGD